LLSPAIAPRETTTRPERAIARDQGDPPIPEPGAALFVWATWGLLATIAFVEVARFGPDVPLWDDYAVIPRLTGSQPITLDWLWSQHSEHRIPLARLILLGTFRLTGADPRGVMFLIVGLLSALSAVLLRAARAARGGTRYADAFLPIALLNLGHHENFLWAIQITYVLPVVLMGFVLALLVRSPSIPGLGSLAAASSCLTLMPLCNAGGLALIPAMAAWLWGLALLAKRTRTEAGRSRAISIAALSIPPLLLSVLYFRGYSPPRHHAAPGGFQAASRTTVQFLAMSLGRPGAILWPLSGMLVVGLIAGSAAVLAWAWFRKPAQRARVLGLACALAAAVSLAAGTGWGRSGEAATAGLQPRYTTLAVPALFAGYFAFACYGPGPTRQFVPMVLLAGSCLLAWPNTEDGWSAGRNKGAQAEAFDRDLASGTPLFRLVRRYTPFLHPSQESLHESLRMLRIAGIGRFQTIQDDPPFREQAVRLTPADIRLARWDDGRIEVTGVDPWIRFDLPSPVAVCGVQIRYSHESDEGAPARFQVAWRRPGQFETPRDQQYGNWNLPTGSDRSTTIWVDDVVSQIRIQPDNRPCRFIISELTLLTPPRSDPGRP
jgi:hypothetical protein